MNDKIKMILIGIVIFALGAVSALLVGKWSASQYRPGGANPTGPFIENYIPAILYGNGYYSALGIYTTNTLQVDGNVTFNATTTMATTTINGLLTYSSNVRATTTTGANSATLSEADLLGFQYLTVNIDRAADFTYTLPASSTLTSLLANTGERSTWCFDNATTAVRNLIFASGTGIDLQMIATSTNIVEYVGPVDIGCLTLIRKANTDLFGNLEVWDDSD